MPSFDRLAYSPAEAAAVLGISRAKLYTLIADGSLPSVKLGRSRRVMREALLQLMADNVADPKPAA